LVDQSLVDDAHHRGLKVLVWTVDDEDRIAELASWSVDGIITNRPGVARRVLDELA
jgi:glycerophosphoryl diester phosphodiesterase